MKNIQDLQKRIEYLEKENKYLKSLLDNAQIPYDTCLNSINENLFESDQGARIIHRDITSDDANMFFSMFWGRTDVYSNSIW